MFARAENISNFEALFNAPLSPSEEKAYAQGQADYWLDISCDASRHNYGELTKERNQYEAGYASEEYLND